MAFFPPNIDIINETDPKFSYSAIVEEGAISTIAAGTPTKLGDATAAASTGEVIPMVDGDGTTSQRFSGIAKGDSTETVTVEGSVVLWLPLPGYVYSARAKLATDVNTAAKLNAMVGKRTVFDLTATLWTIDAGATDAAASMLVIIGGEWQTSTVYFMYKNSGTIIGAIA